MIGGDDDDGDGSQTETTKKWTACVKGVIKQNRPVSLHQKYHLPFE